MGGSPIPCAPKTPYFFGFSIRTTSMLSDTSRMLGGRKSSSLNHCGDGNFHRGVRLDEYLAVADVQLIRGQPQFLVPAFGISHQTFCGINENLPFGVDGGFINSTASCIGLPAAVGTARVGRVIGVDIRRDADSGQRNA